MIKSKGAECQTRCLSLFGQFFKIAADVVELEPFQPTVKIFDGKIEFIRVDCQLMVPIWFWILLSSSSMIATYCGLKVDTKARVIDVYGEPISGLYAAGEICGGFHGAAYMTGTAFSKAAAFGRVAAEQVEKVNKAGK